VIDWKKQFRPKTLLGWLPFVIFVLVVEGDAVLHGPEAKAHVARLRADFFQPPADIATLSTECRDGSKPRQAFYGCTYRSALPQGAILSYYREAFSSRGWAALGCDGRSCTWSRAPYNATLEWRGQGKLSNDWDFGVDYTWRR
jgi:hypothetical protein